MDGEVATLEKLLNSIMCRTQDKNNKFKDLFFWGLIFENESVIVKLLQGCYVYICERRLRITCW